MDLSFFSGLGLGFLWHVLLSHPCISSTTGSLHAYCIVRESRKGDNCMNYNNHMVYESCPKYMEKELCSRLPKGRHRRMIEVEKVLGMGTGNTTVEVCIPLCPPAVQVFDCLSREEVKFDALIAKNGKVFINGRLFKCIPYSTRCGPAHADCHGSGCAVFGATRNAIAEVPFIICVDVPGAVKGAKAVVVDYDVTSVNLPNYGCCNPCLIRSITEKDCISVKVKVVEPHIMPYPNEYSYEYF
jgi:hypothetical protein